MTNLIDYILDLFRSPDVATAFVRDPDGAMRDAGLPNVSAAQLQAVAAAAAPAGIALGGGDPVYGLQQAVANYHSIASPFSPQTSFAPQTQTDFASHNATQLASNNDFMSPDQSAGANAQNGAFNLGLGDITLGDKTSNTANNGGVVVGGDSAGTVTTGDGNVVGHGNSANTGIIDGGSHSPILIGEGNDAQVHDTSQHAGGDVIDGNQGTVIKDNDMSGGHGGSASSSAGGGLLNIGNHNEANAGGGGGGGSIIVNDDGNHSNTSTSAVGGNQTTVGHDLGSGNTTTSNDSVHTVSSTHTDSSYEADNSVHTDSSLQTDSSLHTDSSVHSDNSFQQENSLHQSADTHIQPDTHIGF